MDAQATEVLFGFFADLPDPRRHNVRHLFSDILAIAILAVMCRADDWSEIVLYANAWKPWLATFLSLPNGIPCEDTFRRVFARINPDAFEQCFIRWTTALAEAGAEAPEGRLIPIDGKTIRHSFKHVWNRQGLHRVSAWCEHNQIKVWVTDEVKWLGPELLALWPGLSSVAMVERTRQDLGDMTGKVSIERGYYIASLKGTDAAKMAGAIRGHWAVENKLHWRLDMAFREDESRLRKDHSAENFSRLRRIAMNPLRKNPEKKTSLKGQRFLCSLDPDYLLKRLQQ